MKVHTTNASQLAMVSMDLTWGQNLILFAWVAYSGALVIIRPFAWAFNVLGAIHTLILIGGQVTSVFSAVAWILFALLLIAGVFCYWRRHTNTMGGWWAKFILVHLCIVTGLGLIASIAHTFN